MKLQNMVKFPLTGLDMTPHVVKRSQSSWRLPSHWSPWRRPYGLGRDPEDYIYDLYAVCNHHGTMQGGHYTGLQRERPGACADDPPDVLCLRQGGCALEPCFLFQREVCRPRGQLSPSSSLFPGLIWSGSDQSRESGGLCRGVASFGSPRTCLLDLTCTAPFKVLLCFLQGLASP